MHNFGKNVVYVPNTGTRHRWSRRYSTLCPGTERTDPGTGLRTLVDGIVEATDVLLDLASFSMSQSRNGRAVPSPTSARERRREYPFRAPCDGV